jgi:hypothetical protein
MSNEHVEQRQRRRHPKAFAAMDELRAFRGLQQAEMDRLKIPKKRQRFGPPPVIRHEKPVRK